MRFLDFLREPEVVNLEVDGVERIRAHRDVIQRKAMIRCVFREIHDRLLHLERSIISGNGLRLEIGSGAFPLREADSGVLATDLMPNNDFDRVLNAEEMDLEDNSVRVIFGQNCFHHLPHPERFFTELRRVLVPGGGTILVEPFSGPFARFVFRHLFSSETFDVDMPGWNSEIQGSMSGANQALSYIVFGRDRQLYDRMFPDLPMVHQEILSNGLRYILSGGLNFRQLAPDFTIPAVRLFEKIATPIEKIIGLHQILVIRKR
jgi:SAM-dependent methyltransferase